MSAFESTILAPPDPADEVRVFYESHPYPAPLKSLDEHRKLYQNLERRRALSLLMWPTKKARAGREILVAGCGTSQGAAYAMRESDAHVTGIDISETSLGHTRELQRKYGLKNLDLHRLAIEDVGALGQVFDEIVCTGVLHHLPDPDIGLRSLRGALAPDGALHVMVYGTYGRAGITMMQEYCRLIGVRATEDELQDLAATIDALSGDHPIASVTRRAKDFQRPDALATRCSILRTAPILCRNFTLGSSYAASPSRGGSSRRPICRNAGRSQTCRTPRVSARCRRRNSTPPSSCCAGP